MFSKLNSKKVSNNLEKSHKSTSLYKVLYLHSEIRSGCSFDLEDECKDEIFSFLPADTTWDEVNIDMDVNSNLPDKFGLDYTVDFSRGACVIIKNHGQNDETFTVIDELVSYRSDMNELREYVNKIVKEFIKKH